MPTCIFLQAYVDFVSDLPLTVIARQISDICFAGVDFLGENEGIWDEVPALQLARPVLGLEVILGGSPGIDKGYTLQVSSKDALGGVLPTDPEESKSAICDFSNYLAALIQQIPGTEMKDS